VIPLDWNRSAEQRAAMLKDGISFQHELAISGLERVGMVVFHRGADR
jgi:hypothetical protein